MLRHSRLAILILFLSSILLPMLLVEGILRALNKVRTGRTGWRALHAPASQQNQLGFRGQSIDMADDHFVVILLGDSQVEADSCDLEQMPEKRLQHHLSASGRRVRVFSIGAGGYGQDQELLALQEYFQKFRADLVLLWQTYGNDIWNNTFPTHIGKNGTPKPTFILKGDKLLWPTETIGGDWPDTSWRLVRLVLRLVPRLTDRDWAWERYLPPPYEPNIQWDGPYVSEWQERYDQNISWSRAENIRTEKSHWALSLSPRSPRMQYGINLTRALISEIQKGVARRGARFTTFSTPASWIGPDEKVQRFQGKFYRTSRQQMLDNIAEMNEGFPHLDLPIRLSDWKVSKTDSHLNPKAVDAVMHDLAELLHPLIDSPRTH